MWMGVVGGMWWSSRVVWVDGWGGAGAVGWMRGIPGDRGRDVCPRWVVGWCSREGRRSGPGGSQVFIKMWDICPGGVGRVSRSGMRDRVSGGVGHDAPHVVVYRQGRGRTRRLLHGSEAACRDSVGWWGRSRRIRPGGALGRRPRRWRWLRVRWMRVGWMRVGWRVWWCRCELGGGGHGGWSCGPGGWVLHGQPWGVTGSLGCCGCDGCCRGWGGDT